MQSSFENKNILKNPKILSNSLHNTKNSDNHVEVSNREISFIKQNVSTKMLNIIQILICKIKQLILNIACFIEKHGQLEVNNCFIIPPFYSSKSNETLEDFLGRIISWIKLDESTMVLICLYFDYLTYNYNLFLNVETACK